MESDGLMAAICSSSAEQPERNAAELGGAA
jgi:hypothetical protein